MASKQICQPLLRSDLALLEHLHERCGGDVFQVALAVTQDRAAAAEVTCAVLVGLWRRPEDIEQRAGSLRQAAASIAYRRALSWADERQSSRINTAARRAGELANPRGAGIEPESSVLDALPADERVAIALARFGGLDSRQIAEELASTDRLVKAAIASGLRRIAASTGEQAARSQLV